MLRQDIIYRVSDAKMPPRLNTVKLKFSMCRVLRIVSGLMMIITTTMLMMIISLFLLIFLRTFSCNDHATN